MKRVFYIAALLLIAGCTAAADYSGVYDFRSCEEAGFPVMESYPRQCAAPDGRSFTEIVNQTECWGMNLSNALEIAYSSSCMEEGNLTDIYMCNDITGTWWIDMDVEGHEGCSPACVVNVAAEEAEINWRCTGLLPE